MSQGVQAFSLFALSSLCFSSGTRQVYTRPVLTAITREVSPSIAKCELTHMDRQGIDYQEAVRQHGIYVQLLRDLGCRVIALPAEQDLPDSVFVEDAALVLDEVALLMRPGAASRRPEVDSIAEALAPHRECLRIAAPGTVDGGDVLRVGRDIFVGLSSRSNEAGIAQMRTALAPHGYRVTSIQTRDCLHLKTAVTALDAHSLLINREWVDPEPFGGYELVDIDPSEPFAANVVPVGQALIHAEHFPRTRELLLARSLDVRPVVASELAKAEGAVTCCSLIFESSVAV